LWSNVLTGGASRKVQALCHGDGDTSTGSAKAVTEQSAPARTLVPAGTSIINMAEGKAPQRIRCGFCLLLPADANPFQ